jgi:MinD superfamily P-loop ATPase
MEIAVISGKGGTGKSSVSAAFATLLPNVVLADCDVDAANLYLLFHPTIKEEQVFISGQKAVIDKVICTNCGVCVNYCRFDAISETNGEVLISETSCDGCQLCARICPMEAISMVQEDKSRLYAGDFRNGKMVYGRLSPGEENSGRLVDVVREKAKAMARAAGIETIIIDGPPGIGCPVISSVTGVDRVVVVTEPTLSGLHDLKRTLEVTSNFGIKTQVIINKFDLNEDMSNTLVTYCAGEGITVTGKIPFDPQVVEAMVHCKSIVEYAPDSETSRIISSAFNAI